MEIKCTFSMKLSVVTFIENNIVFIYSPSLDLTGYGYTEKEAMESFEATIQEYANYIIITNAT